MLVRKGESSVALRILILINFLNIVPNAEVFLLRRRRVMYCTDNTLW